MATGVTADQRSALRALAELGLDFDEDARLQGLVLAGADASAAAGPVGRTSGAATDVQLHAEILSYSRSRGLFAGLSLVLVAVFVKETRGRELEDM
jgi:lipid-binding SYLF domain-containing protein